MQVPSRFTNAFISVLPCTAIAVAMLYVVPLFQQVYTRFNATLTSSTRVVLATYRWWWVLPIVLLACLLLSPASQRKRTALLVGAGVAAVVLLFALYSLYRPAFRIPIAQ
jgi:type II secretory pathway component PulF